MNQADEAFNNEAKFNEILSKLDYDLWQIHKVLKETNLKPQIVAPILWKIFEVVKIAGQGKVNIHITKTGDKYHLSLQGIPEPPQSDYHFEAIEEK